MSLKHWSLLFVVAMCVAEDVLTDNAQMENRQDEVLTTTESPQETCQYQDETKGLVLISFMNTEDGIEPVDVQSEGLEGGDETSVPQDSDAMEEMLIKCLKGNLEGRIIKRRKNGPRAPLRRNRPGAAGQRENNPKVILQRMQTQLTGALHEISIPELKNTIRLAQRLLQMKTKKRKNIRNKQRRQHNRPNQRNR